MTAHECSLTTHECIDCNNVLLNFETDQPAQVGELGFDSCAGCGEVICYDCRVPTGYGEHTCEACAERGSRG